MDLIDGGDARSLQTIFDRHAAAAWLLAYRMCGRRAMADDIVQEAFLSLWRGGRSCHRGRGSVRTWVLSVVYHRAVEALRRSPSPGGHNVRDQSMALQALPRERDDHVQLGGVIRST